MEYEYEGLKKGLLALSEANERAAAESPDADKIVSLQLAGRTINIALYGSDPKTPVVFGCHGGGFLIGSYVQDAQLWREMSKRMGVTVISIAYRHTPTYTFPVALYDVYDAMAYAIDHADELGISTDDVSVCGYSAGGNLAAAVCLLDAQRGNKLSIRRQFLNYPYLDLATSPTDKGHVVSERNVYEVFRNLYCDQAEAANPLVSPIYANEELLKNVPTSYVALAERDPLMAEGARYASKLRGAGVDVKLIVATDVGHGYAESAFQPETSYMDDVSRTLLRDGTMRARALQTIDFMAAGFGPSRS